MSNGKKYQFVNINLDDVDDVFAKVIVKIYSRLIFSFAKGLSNRASIPFHLIVEEAHRYIQNDTDTFLIGYNIFDRIAKEGRKYGVILGLITQRPVEMSDTVISQCSNFLIFKMNHPADVDYIRKMVPNISDEIVEKQKTLQSGTCLAFGMAFTIPLIVRMKMPNPAPKSGNCDVVAIWDGNNGKYKESKGDNVEQKTVQQEQRVLPTQQVVLPKQQVVAPSIQPVENNNVNQQQAVTEDTNQPKFIHTVDNNNYNTIENYNSNVDDGSLNPNEIKIAVNDNVTIPSSTNFINTESSLTPNIEIKSDQPQIIIPEGQGVGPQLMEGFGDNVKIIEE